MRRMIGARGISEADVVRSKRLGVVATGLAMLAIALAACAGSPISPSSNSPNNITFITPDASQYTATPIYPAFTIGAWVSNYSPNTVDTITIYAILRVQDPTMRTPAQPPPSQSVHVVIGPPVNTNLSGTSDADGIAAIPFNLNDSSVGQPVDIYVTTNWKGQLYTARTFFTPSPSTPPTATPQPTQGSGGTPTATP